MNVLFGNYSIKVRKDSDHTRVFDIVRKKWVVMTPEEQVRQLWLHYLAHDMQINLNSIAVEKQLIVNQKPKRFDICIFGNDSTPSILIECKSPKIELNLPVMEQLLNYNMILKTKKFIITNGIDHYGYELGDNQITEMDIFTI